MDIPTIPGNAWLAGLAIVAIAGLSLAFDGPKASFMGLLMGNRKAPAGAPPSSAPSGRPAGTGKPGGPPPAPNYPEALPPLRRHVLATLKNKAVPFTEVDEKKVWKQALPIDMDYRTCTEERYTPTGFTVKEIKALGDFPNYAELSGVPLPQPYHKFNIEKALPRPYRPIRWNYHQTMGMSQSLAHF